MRNPTQLGLTTSNLIESRPQQRKDRQGQASPPAEQQEPSSPSETKPHPAGETLRAGPTPTPAQRCLSHQHSAHQHSQPASLPLLIRTGRMSEGTQAPSSGQAPSGAPRVTTDPRGIARRPTRRAANPSWSKDRR
eukprot:366301-Chlamydomonas_euryale.AAC.3